LLAIPTILIASLLMQVAMILALLSWFAILFTGTLPGGLASFMVGSLRWYARATGYMYLLTDRYPPFSLDPEPTYPIRCDVDAQLENRNRATTFFRIILAIPHFVILGILGYVMVVVGFIAWLVALFTGRLPDGLHNFIAGYVRWTMRVYGYLLLLVDEYPPFSFSEE
jgi:hypothetical protein